MVAMPTHRGVDYSLCFFYDFYASLCEFNANVFILGHEYEFFILKAISKGFKHWLQP